MAKLGIIFTNFKIPLIVAGGILIYLFSHYYLQNDNISFAVVVLIVIIGSFDLLKDTLGSIIRREFALDYIAITAIVTALVAQQYLVAAVIVLMLSGGNALEKYGMLQAKQSLTALVDRIPNKIIRIRHDNKEETIAIEQIEVGDQIMVRKGEVVALDGILLTAQAEIDESSLTGEPYMMDKVEGDLIRSGTLNTGDVIKLKVAKSEKDSTYRKIVEMVREAQDQKAPLIRLADKYSAVFTLITFVIAGSAFYFTRDLQTVLAVLVIATPCPLILATPIALLGGMSKAAKSKIIIKNLGSLEVLSRVTTMIFDKTGTITLGRPEISALEILDQKYSSRKIYGIAEAIERNSLHPLAKAIVAEAKKLEVEMLHAENVKELLGKGISAEVEGEKYVIGKAKVRDGMAIELRSNANTIAIFHLEDKVKDDSLGIIKTLEKAGMEMTIFTGDKQENAEKVAKSLGSGIAIKAECTPEDKKKGIHELKKAGKIVAMVGDGINDAPALAYADVGMVFSNEEHTAASEAADVVFLAGNLKSVTDALLIARRTIGIAMQSILIGIGVSTLGMVLAAFGFIPPVVGAFIQEGIDIFVIINALRTSR